MAIVKEMALIVLAGASLACSPQSSPGQGRANLIASPSTRGAAQGTYSVADDATESEESRDVQLRGHQGQDQNRDRDEPTVADRHGTMMPRICADSLEVVDYLADCSVFPNAFDPTQSKAIDPEIVLSAIHESGLRFTDVNDATDRLMSRDEIAEQLLARAGPAFRSLVHLGHIYAQPLQYSRVKCLIDGDTLLIELTHWYRLTYRRVGPVYKFTRVAYVEQEGD